MAFSSASAVSPTLAVDNTAKANTFIGGVGQGRANAFLDSLEAVLASPISATAKTATTDETNSATASLTSNKLTKLKSKLMNSDAGVAVTPLLLQQQQAVLQKLDATNTSIDMPALRAAMGNVTAASSKAPIMPVVDPSTGKISIPKANVSARTEATATNSAVADAANATIASSQTALAPNATAPAAQNSVANTPVKDAAPKSGDTKKTAQPVVAATTQAKLVASLVKTATAPVLKNGETDGSKVPNAKIARPVKAEKSSDPEMAQSMAAKIAATAAITNTSDAASTAAQGVAVAEVSTRTAAAPSVTKIEAAAMTNATQAAVHATVPQEKIEAQALPIQFDAQPSKQDSNADTKSGTDSKDQNLSGSARAAADTVAKNNNAPAANFADNTQPSTPAPAHTNTAAANTTTAAANASTPMAAPVSPAHIATTLQVSQQAQHSTPSDEATFAALGVAIAAKSKDGEKQFDINMHPAELGRVDVRISVDSDGKAQAHLSAEHPQTLQLLQNDKATLERNLRDAGLDVANNGLSFSLKGEQQPSTPTFNARSRALSISTVQSADISSTASSSSSVPGDSRLDIRV